MKHISTLNDFLLEKLILEIGEGSSRPYNFKILDDQRNHNKNGAYRRVSFQTEDGDQYNVAMNAFWGDHYVAEKEGAHFTIDFYLKDPKTEFIDTDIVVNKGRLFRVMATVIKIAEKFMNDIDYKKNDINLLKVSPTKTEGEFDDRRAKLYMAYIKRQLPVASIKYDGDEIVAKIR